MKFSRHLSLVPGSILSLALGATSSFAQSKTNIPPSHPYVSIYSPINNSRFVAPANISIYVRAYNSPAVVQTVEFFVGTTSLGVVSNSSQVMVTNISNQPLFPLTWSNVLSGSYALRAVATDSLGLSSTSAVVNISVVTNLEGPIRPFVYIYSPTNNSKFLAPANIPIYARAYESTGIVQTVEFFAGSTSLGIVSNSSQVIVSNISYYPVFPLTWSNVPAGEYVRRTTDAAAVAAVVAALHR